MDSLLNDEKLKPYLSQIIDKYSEAYHSIRPNMTDEDIIEELLADYRAGFDMLDPLGMNPITARAAKRAAKDIRAVERKATKAAARDIRALERRSVKGEATAGREGAGSYSTEIGNWQSYELTDEFMREVPSYERHAFLRSLATNTSTMEKGKTRNIAITTADHLYLFEANGYMNGSIVEKIDLNTEIDRAKRERKEFLNGPYKNAAIADIWSDTVSDIRGEPRSGVSVLVQRRGENAGDDTVSGAEFGRDGAADYEGIDGYSEEEIGDLPEGRSSSTVRRHIELGKGIRSKN